MSATQLSFDLHTHSQSVIDYSTHVGRHLVARVVAAMIVERTVVDQSRRLSRTRCSLKAPTILELAHPVSVHHNTGYYEAKHNLSSTSSSYSVVMTH